MKHLLYCVLVVISLSSVVAQSHRTGLIFDDEAYKKVQRLSPALRFSATSLPSFSLKAYCPDPGNQGDMGSCVGWATAYAALTIADAVNTNSTDRAIITTRAKSALYVYNQIKVAGCPEGAHISDALMLVQQKGVCRQADFNPPTCYVQPGKEVDDLARAFRITDYYRIFDYEELPGNKVSNTINSLQAKKPVVVGMVLTGSIDKLVNGEWMPQAGEIATDGHALCVVGFDNGTKRFEIMNSWGPTWGNGGFFSMSYDNFGRYCKYGFQFSVAALGMEQAPLSGVFRFKKYQQFNLATNKYEFNDIKPMLTAGKYYTFADGAVRRNDFFRIAATDIQKDNFVYIFSIKPNRDAEILFPLVTRTDAATVKDIPIVPAAGMTIEIPADEKKGITTDQVGDDYLCILYSRKRIDDIEAIVETVRQSSEEFYDRLRSALGDRLVPEQNIVYEANEMRISTKGTAGFVAPIVLKVHVID